MSARAPVSDEEQQLLEKHRRDKDRVATEQRESELGLLRRAREGDEGARTALLKTLSSPYESPVVGVIRVASDPPTFHLLIDDGKPKPTRLTVGGIEALDNQGTYCRAFLLALGWKPPRVKPAEWDTVVTQLVSCAKHETPDEAQTDAGRGARWLTQYFRDANVNVVDLTCHSSDEAGRKKRRDEALSIATCLVPFRDSKGVHVFLPPLQRHIRQASHGGEAPTAGEVANCIKAADCERVNTKFPNPKTDDDTTKSTWIVPPQIAPYA